MSCVAPPTPVWIVGPRIYGEAIATGHAELSLSPGSPLPAGPIWLSPSEIFGEGIATGYTEETMVTLPVVPVPPPPSVFLTKTNEYIIRLFTINMPILIQGRWFLTHEQFGVLEEKMIPLVDHELRWRDRLPVVAQKELHYVVTNSPQEYEVPARAGAIVNVKYPEEWINKYLFEERMYSDNITDYIKAAWEYLNIKIEHRPQFAWWYRQRFKDERLKTKKVGVQDPNIQQGK